ncbi:ribosomal protein L35, putative [Babesia caballi]|uniref:50S ribosomal protein L35 n=1 Tax=Babesia caballi TaxID=5871 RepID=A0AAV4M0L0_BABCB|nr:ribosomal protein L35, putative [Babesia caballi]
MGKHGDAARHNIDSASTAATASPPQCARSGAAAMRSLASLLAASTLFVLAWHGAGAAAHRNADRCGHTPGTHIAFLPVAGRVRAEKAPRNAPLFGRRPHRLKLTAAGQFRIKPKTNKSVAKRFKITGTGKIMYKRAGRSHLQRKKSQGAKRRLRRPVQLKNPKMIRKILSPGVPAGGQLLQVDGVLLAPEVHVDGVLQLRVLAGGREPQTQTLAQRLLEGDPLDVELGLAQRHRPYAEGLAPPLEGLGHGGGPVVHRHDRRLAVAAGAVQQLDALGDVVEHVVAGEGDVGVAVGSRELRDSGDALLVALDHVEQHGGGVVPAAHQALGGAVVVARVHAARAQPLPLAAHGVVARALLARLLHPPQNAHALRNVPQLEVDLKVTLGLGRRTQRQLVLASRLQELARALPQTGAEAVYDLLEVGDVVVLLPPSQRVDPGRHRGVEAQVLGGQGVGVDVVVAQVQAPVLRGVADHVERAVEVVQHLARAGRPQVEVQARRDVDERVHRPGRAVDAVHDLALDLKGRGDTVGGVVVLGLERRAERLAVVLEDVAVAHAAERDLGAGGVPPHVEHVGLDGAHQVGVGPVVELDGGGGRHAEQAAAVDAHDGARRLDGGGADEVVVHLHLGVLQGRVVALERPHQLRGLAERLGAHALRRVDDVLRLAAEADEAAVGVMRYGLREELAAADAAEVQVQRPPHGLVCRRGVGRAQVAAQNVEGAHHHELAPVQRHQRALAAELHHQRALVRPQRQVGGVARHAPDLAHGEVDAALHLVQRAVPQVELAVLAAADEQRQPRVVHQARHRQRVLLQHLQTQLRLVVPHADRLVVAARYDVGVRRHRGVLDAVDAARVPLEREGGPRRRVAGRPAVRHVLRHAPELDAVVQRAGRERVHVLRAPLGHHHVVLVAAEHAEPLPVAVNVPEHDGHVVRAAQHPGQRRVRLEVAHEVLVPRDRGDLLQGVVVVG